MCDFFTRLTVANQDFLITRLRPLGVSPALPSEAGSGGSGPALGTRWVWDEPYPDPSSLFPAVGPRRDTLTQELYPSCGIS